MFHRRCAAYGLLLVSSAFALPGYSQTVPTPAPALPAGPRIAVTMASVLKKNAPDQETIAAFYKDATRFGVTEEFRDFALLLERCTTDDWTVTDKDGKVHSRREQLALHRHATRHPETAFKGDVAVQLKMQFQGNTAQVQIMHTGTSTEADTQGQYGTKGATHRVVRVMTGRDTWVKTAGRWKLQKAVDGPTRLTVDDKLVPEAPKELQTL